ncbi:ABC transporter permease subunit [Sodalis sp. RH21]|uniref:ABC transporter permease subunit n=1 Tax=unclassified Sodalis (in: enterobacteria) TaxID=2636512 RepID=UPI0039B67E10
MTIKRLANTKTAPYRRFHDRLTRGLVSGGGLLVLLALLVMFCYLLYAVFPLFRAPAVTPVTGITQRAPSAAPAGILAVGADDSLAWSFYIDSRGQGALVSLQGTSPPPAGLMADFSALAPASGGQPLFLLGDIRGGVRLVRPAFPAHPAKTAIWTYPFGDNVRVLGDGNGPLRHMALAQPAENQAVMAAQLSSGRVVVARLGPQGMVRRELDTGTAAIDRLLLAPDGRLLYLLAGNELSIYPIGGEGPIALRQRQVLAAAGPVQLTLLPVDGSLLVRDAARRLSLWFDITDEGGRHLARIREFTLRAGPDAQILVSAQRPVFGVLAADGAFALFTPRLSAPRAQTRLVPGAVAAFSPVSDDGHGGDNGSGGIVLVDGAGWHLWRLRLASPDISWRTLTQKVWYSHYPAPTLTWQSTAANEGDSGKFSLVPLLAGTLKAAGYAMLFATPLALAAAIYSAWFMAPALRRWIKPAMEIMGAVPSVIVGLIAGLWLAPYYGRVLSGILLLPLALPPVILAVGWGLGRMSAGGRKGAVQGWGCLLLLPPVALTVWGMCRLSPLIDRLLFGQPLSAWLGDDYNPMNALVVGTAMGFALIPLMFSLAEDALFNVPVRLVQGSLALGATPWQTLLGVTLPSASAGLFSAFILGLGRAIGETMIVLMASGNMPRVDGSLFQGLRALAANIAIEIPEAPLNSEHYRILLLTALVLFVFTFLINTLAEALRLRLRARYRQQDGEAG